VITTGNSINVARLFPQALCYFYAYCQLGELGPPAIFSIPCGNFGHLVSGILAKRMGLPVERFLAATNINDSVPAYLRTGVFRPHEAYHTLAVSMDVGNPSNFPRLLELYDHSLDQMRHDLLGISFTDAQIIEAIQNMYADHGYILDPHSATAYLALKEVYRRDYPGILFSTAHPAKFRECINMCISASLETPKSLQEIHHRPQQKLQLPPAYSALKELLFVLRL